MGPKTRRPRRGRRRPAGPSLGRAWHDYVQGHGPCPMPPVPNPIILTPCGPPLAYDPRFGYVPWPPPGPAGHFRQAPPARPPPLATRPPHATTRPPPLAATRPPLAASRPPRRLPIPPPEPPPPARPPRPPRLTRYSAAYRHGASSFTFSEGAANVPSTPTTPSPRHAIPAGRYDQVYEQAAPVVSLSSSDDFGSETTVSDSLVERFRALDVAEARRRRDIWCSVDSDSDEEWDGEPPSAASSVPDLRGRTMFAHAAIRRQPLVSVPTPPGTIGVPNVSRSFAELPAVLEGEL